MSLMSPALAAGCFTTGATCEALQVGVAINYRAHTHRHAHTNAPKSFSIHLPLQTSSYAGSCSPLKKRSLFSPTDLSLHQPSCPSPHLSILTSLLHFLLLCAGHALKASALTYPAWSRVNTKCMVDGERGGERKEEKKEKERERTTTRLGSLSETYFVTRKL